MDAGSPECDPADVERRLEDWLVSYLDDEDPPEQAANWKDLLDAGSLIIRDPGTRQNPRRKLRRRMWTRLSIVRRHSISLVRLLDQFLIKEDVILEIADELRDVVRSGAIRLILDFSNVERMSSQIIGIIGEIHRRLRTRQGGQLKLCGLKPNLVEVFALAGLAEMLSIHADEVAAFSSPWPASEWAPPAARRDPGLPARLIAHGSMCNRSRSPSRPTRVQAHTRTPGRAGTAPRCGWSSRWAAGRATSCPCASSGS